MAGDASDVTRQRSTINRDCGDTSVRVEPDVPVLHAEQPDVLRAGHHVHGGARDHLVEHGAQHSRAQDADDDLKAGGHRPDEHSRAHKRSHVSLVPVLHLHVRVHEDFPRDGVVVLARTPVDRPRVH